MAQTAPNLVESKRILVCDDEPHIVRLIQVNLERLGWTVTGCYDGQQALDHLRTQTFDRVVADLRLPHQDGYQLLKWVRTHERHAGTWFALLVASPEEVEVLATTLYHPDRVFQKPFNPGEIVK